jgi:hypothetical protein
MREENVSHLLHGGTVSRGIECHADADMPENMYRAELMGGVDDRCKQLITPSRLSAIRWECISQVFWPCPKDDKLGWRGCPTTRTPAEQPCNKCRENLTVHGLTLVSYAHD